jgi:iron(III) transport system ATP-binding protein
LTGLDRAMLARKPDALSGEQQQRVALARALARRPKLMLLDEPFSALDTGLRASTRKAVADLLEAAGVTTVLVTHDQAEALSFADYVAIMDSGKILQAGTLQELYFRPTTAMVAGSWAMRWFCRLNYQRAVHSAC